MAETGTIPLFPLNAVLFPHQPLPLHIFEPRYKTMIQDCVDSRKEFGVVLVHQGQLFQNGTCARIENILEKFDDGRLNILTLGKKRFRVKKLLETKEYLEGEVEYWDDDGPVCQRAAELFQQVRRLLKIYAALTGKIEDQSLVDSFNAYGFSFFLAEINMYSLPKQQEVLEMTSARERLECGFKSLGALVEKLQLDRKLRDLLGNTQSFFNICN
jgi:Lon protease-like protein